MVLISIEETTGSVLRRDTICPAGSMTRCLYVCPIKCRRVRDVRPSSSLIGSHHFVDNHSNRRFDLSYSQLL